MISTASPSIETRSSRAVLMIAHCAGMIDLVTLPVWVGTLVGQYGLDEFQAGAMVTTFLLAAVLSSLFFAPRFNSMNARACAQFGFGMAALAFVMLVFTRDLPLMYALHALAGAAAGCALSFTHGSIGRCANPHRMFGSCGIALGLAALVFYGAAPQFGPSFGGTFLFRLFACVMAVTCLVCSVGFPARNEVPQPLRPAGSPPNVARLDPALWFVIFGVACMALVQSMVFGFVERIGIDRAYSASAVAGVLIAIGVLNLFPAPLAMILQRRIPARWVLLAGPLAQAAVALVITQSTSFIPYAAATAMFACVMIFTHTFAFGVVAQLDPSGRTAASTPAMLMTGAAIGPILGGTLIRASGYPSIGIAAALIALLAVLCIWRALFAANVARVPA